MRELVMDNEGAVTRLTPGAIIQQMKAFVVSDDENLWSGFLYDKDCQSEVVRHFLQPGVNAEAALDPAIVAEARDNSQTMPN